MRGNPSPTLYPFRGRQLTLNAIAAETGIPSPTLYARIHKLGMKPEEAFSKPVDLRFKPTKKVATVSPPKAPPKLERHPSGRAWCRWSEWGKRRSRNFGPWPLNAKVPPQSTATAYARWCAEWWANAGRVASDEVAASSVAGLILHFLKHAEGYYQKNGRPTSQVHGYKTALALLNKLYGDTPAASFGVAQLRTLQAEWVKLGRSLNTVNRYVRLVALAFAWAVGQGVIPAAVADALTYLPALVPGRSTAPLAVPVEGVEDAHVAAILPHLHEQPERRVVLVAMVQLQRATGMRPGEVCELRAEDIDRSREPWLYQPASGGKTLHLEKVRKVWLGPKARELLRPWLDAAKPGEFVFRLAPLEGRVQKWSGVTVAYLRDQIGKACKAARVPAFAPNQLRHAKANEVQRRYEDDEAVAAALGNTPEVARQVYTDNPADAVARRIAEATG